jgi:hypothetical protein
LKHCEPAFQTQTPLLNRQRGAAPGSSPLEQSHEPELGCFTADGGVRVGLQVAETLFDKSFSASVSASLTSSTPTNGFGGSWSPNGGRAANSGPRPSRKGLKKLDLLEFAKARPPQDCIGQWNEPQ